MNRLIVFVALLAMVLSFDLKQELLKEDPEILAKWQNFLIKYRRTDTYKTTEDIWYRYNVFKNNLKIAEET